MSEEHRFVITPSRVKFWLALASLGLLVWQGVSYVNAQEYRLTAVEQKQSAEFDALSDKVDRVEDRVDKIYQLLMQDR